MWNLNILCLFSDEVPKKPVQPQDQTVKDSRGRQRFHGAFTGGFSAGYFNSVGSKEGLMITFIKNSALSNTIYQTTSCT